MYPFMLGLFIQIRLTVINKQTKTNALLLLIKKSNQFCDDESWDSSSLSQ